VLVRIAAFVDSQHWAARRAQATQINFQLTDSWEIFAAKKIF